MKKILAYSTIEDMGLMFIALGFGSISAAMLLFVFQTFYKGLIFMDAGALTKANNDETDIRNISVSRRLGFMIPLVIAVAALAGIFPLSGFLGKVAVESAVQNYVVYLVLLFTEVLGSMFIFRWLFVPLSKKEVKTVPRKAKIGYSVPASMMAAIYIVMLAVLGSSAAWFYLPGSLSSVSIGYLQGGLFMAAVVVGLVLSYLFYYRRIAPNVKLRASLSRVSDIGFAVNIFYALVARAVNAVGEAVAVFDRDLYAGFKAAGNALGTMSLLFEKTENGSISYYLVVFIIAAVAMMMVFSVI